MARRKRYDVFVSYSHKDAAIVKPLVQVLSIAKRRVFWDEIIEPGQEWNAEIEAALAASDAIVIMWCCDSAASDWVTREIATARTLAKPLTPIRLCAYPLRGVVLYFQAINLSKSLHHNCDCANKEAQAQKERERAQGRVGWGPMPMPPSARMRSAPMRSARMRPHSRWASLTLALVVGLVLAGYFIYKLDYWRMAVGALLVLLLVGILSFALSVLLDRRTALRKRRAANTIALIEEALRSKAGAKKQQE